MTKIVVEITASDIQAPGCRRAGAGSAERAMRRAGLIGIVDLYWIRVYDRPTRSWREVETPGQLRRFMRLVDHGCQVPPPIVVIDMAKGPVDQGRACRDTTSTSRSTSAAVL